MSHLNHEEKELIESFEKENGFPKLILRKENNNFNKLPKIRLTTNKLIFLYRNAI
jgi:hypothetical protein